MRAIIDLDDRATWPLAIHEEVAKWANKLDGTTEYTGGLALRIEDELSFRDLFEGYLFRVYHCTRLMPHETDMVRKNGLRPLSAELITERVTAAKEYGCITEQQASRFQNAHVFATGEQNNRKSQVCFVLSKNIFRNNIKACNPLLTTWGGEGMYMSSGAKHFLAELKILGTPTIVIALIETDKSKLSKVFPSLLKAFVGSTLGLKDANADIFYKSSVPSQHIENIYQPSNPKYGEFGELPSS